MDWLPRHGVWPDMLAFIFDGGILNDDAIAAIRLPPDELSAYALLPLNEATPRLRPSLARRLGASLAALAAGRPAYLEYGRRVG